MAVTRCVCREVSFERIARLAAELRAAGVEPDAEMMRSMTGCGTGCGTCMPYVAEVVRTGRVSLEVIPGSPQRPAGGGGP
ncbi:MAG: bacterioferritin [Phycisphaeraceae bacterium]|nr:MAG: bacterioferritin [Phycisphaeraceae bacterium]